MQVTLIGIDLAKNVFQLCGVNQAGKSLFNRPVKRNKVFEFLATFPGVTIAMEACSGSNYWGRELERRNHEVLLIPPQHVKPFVKGNKNDRNDAFAICETARRPQMVFVRPRSLEQTDLLLAHRVRERQVADRTRLINQLRGLLQEYGVVLPQGKACLRRALPAILEDADNGLTVRARACFQQLLDQWQSLDEQVAELDRTIVQQCRQSESCQRLTAIRGVAEKTATAVVAFAGNASHYRNARHFAACLGLVPKEHSSGGKQRLGTISKRGNTYIRRLLVQCGGSIIRHLDKGTDRLSRWARELVDRRGKQRTAVALANKLARIIWALLVRGQEYSPA